MAILARESPTYQPAMRIIEAITNGFPAQVTTTFDHDYLTGTVVRLVIPPGYGIVQADQQVGSIVVTGNTTFDIDIDTTFYDSFTVPTTFPKDFQHPQVIPVGELNETLEAATRNVLGG